MSILKYGDYISEKVVYDLLLESKVIYSKKFINLLTRMNRTNKLASQLLSLYTKDIDGVVQNYIDVTDQKDAVSFTPDRKAKELNDGKPETWKVINSGRYLTRSDRNNKIFEALGYDKEKYQCWAPETGVVGTILSETVSRSSGKIYVMFQEYKDTDPRIGVINKEALELSDADDVRVWSTSRNNIKIGRLVRAILTVAKIPFVDKDIEDFTNQYKATYDFAADVLKQFDVVKGGKIAYWYSESNYVDGGGTLNNSCMADVSEDYFDIYTQNPQVSLVILYGDEGTIVEDKYQASLIKGRALLWECEIDGEKATFMDRIYTANDSDTNLFKQFAEKNGWWYKDSQSMEPNEYFTDGNTKKKARIIVRLNDADWREYPYCDTMCYIFLDSDIASNKFYLDDSENEEADRLLRDTEGEYESAYDME
jgi:hypothetical protein